jgi:hypothetical protein
MSPVFGPADAYVYTWCGCVALLTVCTAQGEKVTRAVITVPAYFTDKQRAATEAAGLVRVCAPSASGYVCARACVCVRVRGRA